MREELFKEALAAKIAGVEEILRAGAPEETGYAKKVAQAMNYSLFAGGKRLRPILMQESFRLFGGRGEVIHPFMRAIEMIHSYSLVHDDLPAMDNDDFRRGRPTTHRVFGEDMAVLAGDGLLNLAFETALEAFERADTAEQGANMQTRVVFANMQTKIVFANMQTRIVFALKILAGKAGIRGMIGGQTADMEAERAEEPLGEDGLFYIHKNKTAALIEAALMIGAVLAGADGAQVTAMERCGEKLGLAFQIQDDILDVTGNSEELGKPVGSDAKNSKQTYVALSMANTTGRFWIQTSCRIWS